MSAAHRAPTGTLASALAEWATGLTPGDEDLALARRSLLDTLSVTAAARGHGDADRFGLLGDAGRLAAAAHLVDYDDLHVPSTTHVSAVCVAATLAAGGDARAYLAGAGVMARLGARLGWAHYDAGWHATCTAGAPAAAVAAGVALGLDAERLVVALALAVPGAGGVDRAFGTSGKALQVGFAADAGVRAARLASAGASADGSALEQWLALVGGTVAEIPADPVIPGGLAVKAYPCCYALQRPIAAVLAALDGARPDAGDVGAVTVLTPEVALRPLLHDRPATGLQGKFSLPYGLACALLDGPPGLGSFTDAAVARPAARELGERVTVRTSGGGTDLLAGTTRVELELADERGPRVAELPLPPGAPGRPLDETELARKARDCAGEADGAEILVADWTTTAAALAARLLD